MIYEIIEYSAMLGANDKLYGYNFAEGRAYNNQEINKTLKKFVEAPTVTSSLTRIAHNMAQTPLEIDPLRNFNYEALTNSLNTLNKTLFKNKEVLDYITRKGLR